VVRRARHSGRRPPSFDPVKRWGTTQEAPLTPEYEAMVQGKSEDQRAGGKAPTLPVPVWRPACDGDDAHSPMEIIVLPETTYIRVIIFATRADASTPMAGLAGRDRADLRRLFHRQMDRYRRRWPLRPARGRDPGFKGPRSYDASGCRSIAIISPCSRSASISTRPIPISCTTTSR